MPGDPTVTALTGSIGARVTGVDLREPIPEPAVEIIREAFCRHGVLVFPSGAAGADEQHRLASLFGEPQPLAVFQFLGALSSSITFEPGSRIDATADVSAPAACATGHGRMARELRNLGMSGDHDGWHTDSSFTPWLPRVAVLRAEVIPPVGGDTGFSSLCAAHKSLSAKMQSLLEDLTAVHVVPQGFKEGVNVWQYGVDAHARFDAEYPPREWPVVIGHPETGRRALFVNPAYSVHIVGFERAESNALLRFLFTHIAGAGFQYRHHWQRGDLVLWDEVTVLHRAPDDFAPHERRVVRVTAGRCVPAPPPPPNVRC